MLTTRLGRAMGAMYLAAFLLYGIGALLATSVASAVDPLATAASHPSRLAVGALLILANSVTVVALGVGGFVLLRERSALLGSAYLMARGVEATLLAFGAIALLSLGTLSDLAAASPDQEASYAAVAAWLPEVNELSFQAAMLALAVGSVGFCAALLRHRLLPPWLARWGIVGYAVFGIGAAGELLGLPMGIVFSIPGGLWEVTAGLFLLRFGFAQPVAEPSEATHEEPGHDQHPEATDDSADGDEVEGSAG